MNSFMERMAEWENALSYMHAAVNARMQFLKADVSYMEGTATVAMAAKAGDVLGSLNNSLAEIRDSTADPVLKDMIIKTLYETLL